MRICVAARRDPTRDPHTRALVFSLRSVGHDVTVVCGGSGDSTMHGDVPVHRIGEPRPGVVAKARRKLGGKGPSRSYTAALQEAVAATKPDIVYPVRADDADLAAGTDAMVARRPDSEPAGARDLIGAAPHDVRWSTSPAGPPVPFHLPGDDRPASHPEPGRHRGVTVAVAVRVTPTNPSRYLITALERAGIVVRVLDGAIDWDAVPDDAAAVIVVESPYPALDVRGDRKDIPLLFWAHHGEHHLAANIRLTRRYGADAVLLAHSWHLAHRFPVPVHRFPFAVAPEVFAADTGFTDRSYDVAMVAAGLAADSERYRRRFTMASDLTAALPNRTAFQYGLLPEAMAELYADSKIVLNDGGARHLPITMRVFEALGCGALLVTEDLPGTDALFTPGEHYVPLGDQPVSQVRGLLADPRSASIAAAGRQRALDHHTYDHRVDELLAIAARTEPKALPERGAPADPLAAMVDLDVDVQGVAVFGVDLDLPDRAIRSGADAAARLDRGKTDAVVLGNGQIPDLDLAVHGARRYMYAVGRVADQLLPAVERAHPGADVTWVGDVMRVDLRAPGYRMRPDDHPLAR
jgi:hypothetical protein